jgi:uncharacterized protein (UPF0333 family)
MLNQTNTNATAVGPKEPAIEPADFVIHTMQSDLASLKNNRTSTFLNPTSRPLATIPIPLNNTPAPFAKPSFNETPPVQKQALEVKITPPQTIPPVKIPTPIQTAIPQKKESPDGKTLYKIIFLIIILVVIAIVGFGFYYVYTTTKSTTQSAVTTTTNPTSQQPTQQNLPTEDAVIIAPGLEKYSLTKPNFLPIDFSSTSLGELEAQFSKIAEEIKLLPTTGLYEFTVVDKNNNPADAKTFLQLAKITFSPELLGNLTKDFSLFFYNDNGNVRLGLSLKAVNKEKNKLIAAMVKQEATLTNDLAFLFLKASMVNPAKSFTVSTYAPNNEIVRYLNLNTEKNLSIDYTATADNLLIGTSREAFRIIYKKVTTIQPAAQNELN